VNEVMTTPPTLTGDTVCISGAMTLSATATGDVTWYDDQGILVGTGNTYTTPVLTSTTMFYAMNTDTYNDTISIEPHTNGIGGGGYIASEQYEVFTAHEAFTLKSVKVYAEDPGTFTIELQDHMGMVIDAVNVTVPDGESRVDVNFSVPADTALRLVGTNISVGDGLYRNNASAAYPYEYEDIVSITGASAGASYYYYFYDWEILTTNSTCGSVMTPVYAVVDSCLGIGENILFKRSIKLMPNPNNGNFAVEFETDHDGEMEVQILSTVGTVAYTKTLQHATGVNTFSFDQGNLAKGMYIFNIHFEGKDYPQRIIIE
jgi:hypothetical protein